MNDDVKEKSRNVFDSWFEFVASDSEIDNKERLFEFFYSGYLAGTKYQPGERPIRNLNIMMDDVHKNLDL
jgi:hypothetical protein